MRSVFMTGPFYAVGPRQPAALDLRSVALDQRGDLLRIGVAALLQSRDRSRPVGHRAVLAHLPLADEREHRNLDADDHLDHALDEIGGGLGHGPWRRLEARFPPGPSWRPP